MSSAEPQPDQLDQNDQQNAGGLTGAFSRLRGFWGNNRDKIDDVTRKIDNVGKSLVGFIKTVTSEDTFIENATPDSLGISYVTKRLLIMGFPSDHLTSIGRPIDVLSKYLKLKHPNHYMIWNLAETEYDYSKFENQVLEFNFPGYPAPPLERFPELFSSLYAWLKEDRENVAVLHCLKGAGRSAVVAAGFMAWSGYHKHDISRCLEVTALVRCVPIEKLVIPTQLRYLQYLGAICTGTFPDSSPIVLERAILNGIPAFEYTRRVKTVRRIKKKPQLVNKKKLVVAGGIAYPAPLSHASSGAEATNDSVLENVISSDAIAKIEIDDEISGENTANIVVENVEVETPTELVEEVEWEDVEEYEDIPICRPYLQIFQNGKLIYTSTGPASSSVSTPGSNTPSPVGSPTSASPLRWYSGDDQAILFPVHLSLQGDILIRVRHLGSNGIRDSMLRLGLHTGYCAPGNLRLSLGELDGACSDDRFPSDFWLDLVFRECSSAERVDSARSDKFWLGFVNKNRRVGKIKAPKRHYTSASVTQRMAEDGHATFLPEADGSEKHTSEEDDDEDDDDDDDTNKDQEENAKMKLANEAKEMVSGGGDGMAAKALSTAKGGAIMLHDQTTTRIKGEEDEEQGSEEDLDLGLHDLAELTTKAQQAKLALQKMGGNQGIEEPVKSNLVAFTSTTKLQSVKEITVKEDEDDLELDLDAMMRGLGIDFTDGNSTHENSKSTKATKTGLTSSKMKNDDKNNVKTKNKKGKGKDSDKSKNTVDDDFDFSSIEALLEETSAVVVATPKKLVKVESEIDNEPLQMSFAPLLDTGKPNTITESKDESEDDDDDLSFLESLGIDMTNVSMTSPSKSSKTENHSVTSSDTETEKGTKTTISEVHEDDDIASLLKFADEEGEDDIDVEKLLDIEQLP